MELSVIVPVYNEVENVGRLMSAIQQHLTGIEFELILVDDKSSDKTLEAAIHLKQNNTHIIALAQNYGQSTAIKSGLDYAKGKYVAILDGDLQNDPKDIVLAYQMIQSQKVDMIQGYRVNRHDSLSKRLPSKIANLFIRILFHTDLHDVGCSLKIFKRSLWPSLLLFNGFHRYIPLIAQIQGFTVIEMEVNHSHRLAGKSKYGIERVFPVFRDLLYLRFAPSQKSNVLHYSIEHIHE